MANEVISIKEKIAKHQANRPVGFTHAEKVGSRETIRTKASRHEEVAIKALAKLAAGGSKVPATAQRAAAAELLDRIGGKPKLVDEKQTEQSALEKMNSAELMQYITEQMSGMPLSTRAIMVESLDKGLAFDAADIADVIEEPKGLPPLGSTPKPKREQKIPRR